MLDFDPAKSVDAPPSARLREIEEVSNAEFLDAVDALVEYNWDSERADFDRCPEENSIFLHLRVARAYLSRH